MLATAPRKGALAALILGAPSIAACTRRLPRRRQGCTYPVKGAGQRKGATGMAPFARRERDSAVTE